MEAGIMNTIFLDTPTALHVSFLILALPVSEPSSLRRALIEMHECMPVCTSNRPRSHGRSERAPLRRTSAASPHSKYTVNAR
jgi:hypothetical protein